MAQTLSESLAADLEAIVGRGAVISDPDSLLVDESDALTAYRYPPRAVVLPADTAQVSAVLARLAREGLPVVPRGAGTGLSGGALATGGAVVVGTARMDRILALDPENRLARVQPGVVNMALTGAARAHGLYYAPDPSSQSACTMGGNVAENSGGPHCLKYGVTSRYVTWLTVVLQDGEIVTLGGSAGGAPGYDLAGLLVGSEGCLGVVTELEVRLLPLPESARTLLAIFDRIEAAARAVTDIIGSGLLPAALEIIDGATIRAVEASVFAAGYPLDAGAALVVEFDGTEAGLDAEAERAQEACLRAGAREVRRAQGEAERAALWKGRKKAFGAMGRIAPDLMVQDATVPRTQLPAVLERISDVARRYDLKVANVFHAGDGNLHPNILFDRRDPEQVERVEAASKEIMQVCVDAGGTITGEHGVGLDKRAYMHLVHTPEELSAMAGVKAVFDPRGLLNPGKVIPDGVVPLHPQRAKSAGAAAPPPHRPPQGQERRGIVLGAFRSLLGESAVESGSERWRVGGMEPAAVLRPGSEAEIAACLRLATERRWSVVPAGAGSWLRAGNPGRGVDAVLSVARLDQIVQYEPADLTLSAGAGLSLLEAGRAVAQEAQWLPLDPPGQGGGTLGGTLATGSAGVLATAYGATRDLVLGLRMVTGDGTPLSLGGRVVKNVAGFDLVKLVVGSWGTLGVITEATFRLFPRLQTQLWLVARAPRLEDLAQAARRVASAPLVPIAVELAEGPRGGSPAGAREAALRVRLGGIPERVAREAELIEARLSPLPVERVSVSDEVAAGGTLDLRSFEESAEMVLRLDLLPAELEELIGLGRTVGRLSAGRDELARAPVSMHLDVLRGSLVLGVPHVRSDPERASAWAARLKDVREAMEHRGGSLSISHAPPEIVGVAGAWGDVGPAGRLMAGLKAQFDPAGILSPGRFVLGDG